MGAEGPLRYPRADFTEPKPHGYLYLGMRVDPPGRIPFVRRSAIRSAALTKCKRLAAELEQLSDVLAATVYEAVVIPPVKDSPRFDVIVLVESRSLDLTPVVEACRPLDADLAMPATNIRRIGDVDQSRSGTFLFNHFTASDPESALQTWEDITGWFTQVAGVADSALLRPTADAPYVFVNHVRLPSGPIRFLLNFLTPSFRSFVASRLRANGIGNAPVICRRV